MIKDLIRDLTFDKISLNQALTRAKIIAYEIDNQNFKDWIHSELNGYTSPNTVLPDYRVMSCDVFAVVEAFGNKRMVPMDLSDLDKQVNGIIYRYSSKQSIATIEESIEGSKSEPYGYEELPQPLVTMIRSMSDNEYITSIRRRMQISQFRAILNITKQKLIDTLLELNSAFPNLENNFKNNMENTEKANTIINNHIYGDNPTSNVAVGNNNTQHISNVYNQKVEQFLRDLEEIGVPKEDIKDVEIIVKSEKNESALGKKLMGWMGKMSTKVLEKSLDLQLPLLLAKIHEFL